MTKTMERIAPEVGVRPDTFKTLLVHAEPGRASSHRVEAASRLARELDATLIGLGAETFEPIAVSDPYMGYATGEWVTLVQEQIGKDLSAAEAAFRRDAAGAEIEWRSIQDFPHLALARTAHAADLIVVGPRSRAPKTHAADPADVVMSAGRPVLTAPNERDHLRGQCVVVAWKNTPQCRRAVADAMPFLRRAEEVIVHAVCPTAASDAAVFETDGVVANLKRHQVDARAFVTPAAAERVTDEIERVAQDNSADLIVCGAYGHSRLREWALGGVTDSFLHRPPCFVLMSH
jgi:nucleotide-binding universal stress UspA family protein